MSNQQQYYLPMQTQHKQQLPLLILALKRKLAAVFFKKLILRESQTDLGSEVVQYDHQCEGTYIIVDFFKTKQQTILLKALTAIKQYQLSPIVPPIKKPAIKTTQRTFLNTTLSDHSPVRQFQFHTVKTKTGGYSNLEAGNSRFNKTSVDMEGLLNRVKLINSRVQQTNSFNVGRTNYYEPYYRQNGSMMDRFFAQTATYSQTHERYNTKYSIREQDQNMSQATSKRNSRRLSILNQFSRIENTLHTLGSQKEERSRVNSQIMNDIRSIKQRLRR